MIISTSIKSMQMDLLTLRIANQYGEKRSVFGKACMDDFNRDTRLTFVMQDTIEQDPQQFVSELLSYCPNNKLPETLKKINFVLLSKSKQFAHFANEVFTILSKDYSDIEVNVFIFLKPLNGKDIRRMLDRNKS